MSTSDDKASNNSDFFEELVVEEQPNEEIEQSSPPESAMSAGFALDGALAEAASASLLISEARTADKFGFAREGEGGGSWLSNPLVLGGIAGVTGLTIWGLSSGGGNDPPTVDSPRRAVTVPEDDQVNIEINASDPDGDELTYSVTTAPNNGTAQVVGNTAVYIPNPDYNGADNLTVTVTDAKGNTVTQAIEITVTPVNDAPVWQMITPLSVKQGATGQLDLTLYALDADGDDLTFTKASDPQNGSVLVQPNGSYFYTSNVEFAGTDSFMITVSDGNGGTATDTATIFVIGRTTPMGIQPPLVEVLEDSDVEGESVISDADGDEVEYSIETSPTNGRLELLISMDGSTASWLYTPNPDYNGPDAFEIKGTSVDGFFTEKYVVAVQAVNDEPTAPAEQTLTTSEGTPIDVPLIVSDIDHDPDLNHPVVDRISPTVLASDMPANGTMSVAGNRLIYTPDAGFAGVDTLTVTYTDLAGAVVKTTVTVTVTEGPTEPVDHEPIGTNPVEVVTNEDVAYQGVSDIADPDGDSVTFSINAIPANGTATVDPVTGAYTYRPNDDFNGTDIFTIRGGSFVAGEFLQIVQVTVRPVNDVPVQDAETTTSIIVNNTDTAELKIEFTDVDVDVLTYILDKEPGHGTVTTDVNGKYIYDPVDTYVGPDTFDIKVDDGNGGVVTYSVSVTVTGAEEVSLNGIDPSEPNGSFNAGVGSFILLLSALQVAHMIVTAFGIDDVIRISNGTPDDFALIPGGNSEDLFLESIGAPLLQKIFIPGLFAESGPPAEYTFPSIAETLGFNPFEFTVIP